MTSFEATNSVFKITDEIKSFSIGKPGRWKSEDGEQHINKLKNILEPKSGNDIELHVKENEEKGIRIEMENSGCILAGFEHFKSEILSELKRAKYRDLEAMVYRLQLSYVESIDIFDVNFIAGSTIGYTLPVGIYEISDINSMLEILLPNGVKVTTTIDDIRLRSNLTTNKTVRFSKKSFFHTKLDFVESDSGPLNNIKSFVQLIPRTYKSEKSIIITGIDKVH